MDINRHNYEAWFLDYEEGNLNEQQVADLLLFLESHADLKLEFDTDFADYTLEDKTTTYNFKEQLKKQSKITSANIDDYLIAENEGLLSHAETEELNSVVSSSPTLKKERKLYSLVYLAKTNAFRFPNKEKLKKRAGFVLPLYLRYAVAAALIGLLVIVGLFSQNQPDYGQAKYAFELPSIYKNIDNSNFDIGKPIKEEGVFGSSTQLAKAEKSETLDIELKTASPNVQNQIAVADKEQTQLKTLSSGTLSRINRLVSANYLENSLPQIAYNEFIPAQESGSTVLNKKPTKLEDQPIGIWDYAGIRIKEDVLGQQNVNDGKIRENDLAKAFVGGVEKIASSSVNFKDKSKNDRITYGISIGKFGIERSTSKK